MSNAPFEQWSQTAKTSFAPFLELSEIATHTCSELARCQLKLMNESMQAGALQLQTLSHAKGIGEVWNAQSKCASEMAPQMMQHAQEMLDTMLEGVNKYQQWFEKQGKNVSEKMSQGIKEQARDQGREHGNGGHHKHHHK